MSKIENVQLPRDHRGNDPADYIGEPEYLGNLKVIELEKKQTQNQPDTEDDLGLIFSKRYRDRLRGGSGGLRPRIGHTLQRRLD